MLHFNAEYLISKEAFHKLSLLKTEHCSIHSHQVQQAHGMGFSTANKKLYENETIDEHLEEKRLRMGNAVLLCFFTCTALDIWLAGF